jgi:hypothetical protein
MKKLSMPGAGCVCYIGDHETDVQCVRAANRALQEDHANVRILSIGACYDSEPNTSNWNFRPDYEAQEVEAILQIIEHIGCSLI